MGTDENSKRRTETTSRQTDFTLFLTKKSTNRTNLRDLKNLDIPLQKLVKNYYRTGNEVTHFVDTEQ